MDEADGPVAPAAGAAVSGRAAKLSNDKKTTHFVQPVKEPMEEKEKEKEKEKKEKGSKDTNPDKK